MSLALVILEGVVVSKLKTVFIADSILFLSTFLSPFPQLPFAEGFMSSPFSSGQPFNLSTMLTSSEVFSP
jgi:hypothetical protein